MKHTGRKFIEMTDESLTNWTKWFSNYRIPFKLERGSSKLGAYAVEIEGQVYYNTVDVAVKVLYPKFKGLFPIWKEVKK